MNNLKRFFWKNKLQINGFIKEKRIFNLISTRKFTESNNKNDSSNSKNRYDDKGIHERNRRVDHKDQFTELFNKIFIKDENAPDDSKFNVIVKYRNSIAGSLCVLILLANQQYMISIPFIAYVVYNYLMESKRYKLAHTEIDYKFISENNKKILYAVDEMKNYILKHPELKKFFPEDKTSFEKVNFTQYKGGLLGSAYTHEERLDNKRWEVAVRVDNITNENTGRIHAIVLFHSPTNFVIEYLRFDLEQPHMKKYTIIDGRANMKEWVDQLDEKKIDKRAYPRHREEDDIKY